MHAPPARGLSSADACGQTIQGRERLCNGDQYMIADLDRRVLVRQSSLPRGAQSGWRVSPLGKLFAVSEADRDALQSTIGYILEEIAGPGPESGPASAASARSHQHVLDVLAGAGHRLREQSCAAEPAMQLDTSLTLAYVSWPGLYILHSGVSRCFLFRAGRLYQLTSAHAPRPPDAHGRPADRARSEVHHVELRTGDRLLLCTDGLTRYLDSREITEHLDAALLSANACDHLLRTAMSAGGADDITVVVSRFG